jgi:vitamin B12 transporter
VKAWLEGVASTTTRALLGMTYGLLLSAPAAQAQAPSRVDGRVLDAITQSPVGGAEVSLGDLRATSRSNGEFSFGSVAAGRTKLRVRMIGYEPWSTVIDVVPGLDRRLNIVLTPAPVPLDSIVATAMAGGITISGGELTRRGSDLAHALDGWQGVVVRRTGSAGPAAPQVRGGGPDEMLVLLDGFAINDPLTGRADLSRISSRDVERVTLVPGAQTTRAGGRAIAGLLVVDTRRDIRPEASGWYGSHNAAGMRLGASSGPITGSFSGERYASDYPYSVPEVRGGGESTRFNAGGEQYGATLTSDGRVALSVRGALSRRGLPGTTTNPTPRAQGSDATVFLGIRSGGRLEWAGSLQWLETRAEDPQPPTGVSYDSYTHGVGGTLELGYRHPATLGGWHGDVGASTELRGDRFAGDGVRSGSSFTHTGLRLDGAFHRATGSASWSLAAATRLDLWTHSGAPRMSLRLDAGWQRKKTALTAALGSGVTPPVLSDLFFREGVGVKLNPDLRPERVRWEVETGLRQGLGAAKTSASIRLFLGRVDDMVVWAPDFRFVWSPNNFDVRRRGGELTISTHPVDNLGLDASASYSAVTYDIPGGAQVEYRPRVTYAASLLWSPGAWTGDLRWHHVGQRFPNSAGTNPRPAFSLLDLGVERQVASGLAVRGEVRDLTDARAEFIAGFPTPGRSYVLTLNLVLP